jgi:chitodextrinase
MITRSMRTLFLALIILCATNFARASFIHNLWPYPDSPVEIQQSYYVNVWVAEDEYDSACNVTVYRNGTFFASSTYMDAWQTTGAGYFFAHFSSANNDGADESFTMELAPDTTAPSTPTGLVASSVTDTSFVLSWTASTDAWGVTGYEVKRDTTSLGTATGTSRSVTGLSPTVTYQLTARARDAAGNWSSWSSALAVTPPDMTSPSAPSNLAITSSSVSSVSLSWSGATDNIGVVAYDVYRVRNGASVVVPPPTTGLTYTDSHLLPGTAYGYFVRARDAAGNSSAGSNSVTVTTSALSDSDGDGIPNAIEALFGNVNPTADTSLSIKTHRPN